MEKYLSLSETSELIGKSKETLSRWDKEGILNAVREPVSNYRKYKKSEVQALIGDLFDNEIEEEVSNYAEPLYEYSVLKLFAGAVGLEKAGIKCTALNEIDKRCTPVLSPAVNAPPASCGLRPYLLAKGL